MIDNTIYCPACGRWGDNEEELTLAPGEISWRCPRCSTQWTIKLEFYENEDETAS